MHIGAALVVVPVAFHALFQPHGVHMLTPHLVQEYRFRLPPAAAAAAVFLRAAVAVAPPSRVRVPPLLHALLLQLLRRGEAGGMDDGRTAKGKLNYIICTRAGGSCEESAGVARPKTAEFHPTVHMLILMPCTILVSSTRARLRV